MNESKRWDCKIGATTNSSNAVVVDLDDDQATWPKTQPTLEPMRWFGRARQPIVILNHFEVASDLAINADGELIYFALLDELELVNYDETLSDPN